MNREDELHELLDELEQTPRKLEQVSCRFDKRLRKDKMRKYIVYPSGLVASFFIMFGILVNCVPTFAVACSKVPILRDLAEYVSFSSSLSSAVEHDYVQEINQEETKDGITASIKYVIVDQKQVNVFYTLSSSEYQELDAEMNISAEDGSPLNNYSLSAFYNVEGNDEIRMFKVDFTDETDVPNQILVILKIYNNKDWDRLYSKEEMDSKEKKEISVITEFTFLLEFDPNHTDQGSLLSINKLFGVAGQTLILKEAGIYPTHIRLYFEEDPNNTAWLKGLDFYMKDDQGKEYRSGSGSITSTGDEHSTKTFYLESSYFEKSAGLKLYIEGTQWLDKGKEKLKFDLVNVTADELPEGVKFERATRKGNDWTLTFSAKTYQENNFYQLWGWNYYDENGKQYDISSETGYSSGTDLYEEDGSISVSSDRFYVEFTLVDYSYDTVILESLFTRRVKFEKPIVIDIK